MPRIEWKIEYEIGDALIDEQHMQLFEFADLLYQAIKLEPDEIIIKNAFNGLFLYTKKHFREEEAYFNSINSTLLEEHHAEHRQLEDEVDALWTDEMLGFREGTLKDIEVWVETRLIPHITIADQNAKEARTLC